MATLNVYSVDEISSQTLVETKDRAFRLLNALGTNRVVRGLLEQHGYTKADHDEGWLLLMKASGSEVGSGVRDAASTTKALRELDAWDELGFHVAHASLFRKFPDQAAFIFQDLAPTQGKDAIFGVAKFLDRVDALEKGRAAATEDADKKAAAELAARGIDATLRTHLRGLIATAQASPGEIASPAADAVGAHEEDLRALYAWYLQWTEIARAVITARADQIEMGIAKKRLPKKPTAPGAGAPSVAGGAGAGGAGTNGAAGAGSVV